MGTRLKGRGPRGSSRVAVADPAGPRRGAHGQARRGQAPRAVGPQRGRELQRSRLRRVQRAVAERDDRLGIVPVSGDRDLHRWHQLRMCTAEPECHLGGRRGRGRLAHDPDLRRAAGAGELVRMRRHQPVQGGRAGRRGGAGRGRRRPRIGIPEGNPIYDDMEAYSTTPPTPPRCWRSCRLGPPSCTPSGTCRASTAAPARGSPTWSRTWAPRSRSPTTCGSPSGTTPSRRPARRSPPPTSSTTACTSTGAATTRPTAGHDQHRQRLHRRRHRRHVGHGHERGSAPDAPIAEGPPGRQRDHGADRSTGPAPAAWPRGRCWPARRRPH